MKCLAANQMRRSQITVNKSLCLSGNRGLTNVFWSLYIVKFSPNDQTNFDLKWDMLPKGTAINDLGRGAEGNDQNEFFIPGKPSRMFFFPRQGLSISSMRPFKLFFSLEKGLH